MARIATLSNEVRAPRIEWTTNDNPMATGVPTVNTNMARVASGTASIRVQNPTGWTGACARFTPLANGTDHFLATYLWIDTAPNVETAILGLGNWHTVSACRVVLTPSRTLKVIVDASETYQAGSPTVLAFGTKYLIELRFRRHATTPDAGADQIELRIDGGTEVSSSAVSALIQPSRISVGANVNGESAATCDLYFDTVRLNSSNGAQENTWCGNENIALLVPNAAGEFAQSMTLTGAATAWQAVLDNPPIENANSTYARSTVVASDWTGAGSRFAAAMSDAPSGIAGIRFVSVGMRVRNSSSANASSHAISVQTVNGGTKATDWTSSGWIDDDVSGATWKTNSGLATASTAVPLWTLAPDNNPWTEATVNSLQVLFRAYHVSAQPDIGALWALVSYTSTGGAPSIKRGRGTVLGVGR
jgi:hypothetical protein